ncbi:hypothetical protein [Paraburkholderia azotifigens]|uniref:hypothetical protein n=1 Tax=Paraburkholderia azotifigens TaxID=2057004 RepID=UPI00319DCD84
MKTDRRHRTAKPGDMIALMRDKHPMRIQPARSPHRQAPRTRALVKIAVLVVLVNQILTISFALVARRNHPDIALSLMILFSFLLCAILSAWIRSDAKHAWLHARDAAFLSAARKYVVGVPCESSRTVRDAGGSRFISNSKAALPRR